MQISIIIPVFNEAENLLSLYDEIKKVLKESTLENYEIIFVNDFSIDNSIEIIKNIIYDNKKVRLISNETNKGQSFSIFKGIKNAKYSTIVTIDGDGQNIPIDIKKLLNHYKKNDAKLVGGIRNNRKDSLIKKISSRVANLIRSKYLNDGCLDTGCGLKVFDKETFLEFDYFNGIHRFLPALFRGNGHKTYFIDVKHRSRKYGKSKYGTYKRMINGIKDMLYVKKLLKK